VFNCNCNCVLTSLTMLRLLGKIGLGQRRMIWVVWVNDCILCGVYGYLYGILFGIFLCVFEDEYLWLKIHKYDIRNSYILMCSYMYIKHTRRISLFIYSSTSLYVIQGYQHIYQKICILLFIVSLWHNKKNNEL